MIKMLVVLDEEKIIRDEEFDLNGMKKYVEVVFEKSGITKCDAEGWFLSQDDKYDYGKFMQVMYVLSRNEDIFSNLKQWIWVVKGRTNDVLKDLTDMRLNKINKE